MHPIRTGAAAAVCVVALVGHPSIAQQTGSRRFGPGQCGPVDPSYIRIAGETGGQPFFLSPSEIASSAQIVRETSATDAVLVVWASGTLAGGRRDVAIPIDSTMRRATISASFDAKGGSMTLVAPNGKLDAGITEDSVLNCGRVATIESPPVGTWLARMTATGRYWIAVHGRSDLDFVTAEFVRPAGRPGHEGMFRIPGQPVAGDAATLRVVLTDEEVRSTGFALVSPQHDELRKIEMSDGGGREFAGPIDLPAGPFRVQVAGLDSAGNAYQRLHAGLFHAESVEVAIPPGADTLTAGASSEIPCTIRNAGPAATFQLIAADGRRFVQGIEPRTVTLGSGETATVTVRVAVPADADPGAGVEVTVTASSQGDRPTTNGTSRHFTIARE